jgi:hypothetical protein
MRGDSSACWTRRDEDGTIVVGTCWTRRYVTLKNYDTPELHMKNARKQNVHRQ